MSLSFHELDEVDAVFEPGDWAFARDHAAEIDRYWDEASCGKSGMFNGTVLVQHRGRVEGRTFRAAYMPVEYKQFLAYQRLPVPASEVRNGFGMAALRTADGCFLLGEMGAGTANAGKIYFAAGTPDMGDVRDGRVDLAGSVVREMCEETGLTEGEVRVGSGWTAILMPKKVAFMREVTIDLPARAARALMLERMKSLHEDELSDIVIVGPDFDLDTPRMPDFMQAYLRRAFAASGGV